MRGNVTVTWDRKEDGKKKSKKDKGNIGEIVTVYRSWDQK